MNKINLAIIFGGASSEYEVSLRSATSVINNTNTDLYDLILIGITKEGRWLRYTGDTDKIIDNSWINSPECFPAVISPDSNHHGIIQFKPDKVEIVPIDVVFPVLHGKNGEDGTLQGLLDMAGIPYVGCGVASSANCMDKELTHIILENAGVKTSCWQVVRKSDMTSFDAIETSLVKKLSYPMFVKPACAGSSVGVGKANNKAQLKAAIIEALKHDNKVLVEECIVGIEVECAVMGNSHPTASVVGELEVQSEFYDYDAKYTNDTTTIHIPARIPLVQAETIRLAAVSAYKALGCRGLSRVDFFALNDGKIILNEINTLPGFTSISMYPKMMMESGMSYPQIIDKLIKLALEDA